MKKRIALFASVILPIVALPQTARKPSARSQTDKGPSLPDTNAWIADKLLHFAGFRSSVNRTDSTGEPVRNEISQRITEVNLQDGNWQFTEVMTVNSSTRKKDGSVVYVSQSDKFQRTFKAQDLSPDVSVSPVDDGCYGKSTYGVEVSGDTNCFDVTLASAGKGRAISYELHSTLRSRRNEEPEQSDPDRVSRSVAYRVDILFNNEDTANRVAKAISHAIQLAHSEHPEPF